MRQIICILIVCLLGGLVLAGNSSASICDNTESVIFFGNGVKTLEEDAYDSKNIIKKRLEIILPSEEFDKLEFDLAYNDTHGLPLDLLESTVQILTGNVSRFWRLFWNLEIIPDWFSDKMILLSTALDKTQLVTTDSLWEHVKTYQTTIAEGKKVLLVAHSQGNLFGNMAYENLNSREKQSFGMVAVANVDNNVINADEPYTTLKDDKIILALITAQFALPTKPMSPNTENQVESPDPLGHSFIETYMAAGTTSGTKITQQIVAALDNIVTPTQIVEPGVITVSLTWGSEPDVDLHVYEPNGTQVSWFNLDGFSGYLDRDDRSGYGPEHYNVPSCDRLEGGIYHVALDYYKGYGPEVATLQIKAGLLVRTFEVQLPSEYYGTPYSPELIANIWVKSADNNGYEFEIY
jgi:hypothetical protein